MAGGRRGRLPVPARAVLDLPDQHPREVAVDPAVRLRRVPAPAGVAPVAAEVGADTAAEVAQAQDRFEAGVLFAVAGAADVEAAGRQAGVDVAGERVAVLGEDLLAADPVGLGEEGQGDRAVVVVVGAAVLGGQQGTPVAHPVGTNLVGVQLQRPRAHRLALFYRQMTGQHQAADHTADRLVARLLRVEEGRLGQPAPVAVRQLEQLGALFVIDQAVRVQQVDRLEQRPHRAGPVPDGVRARREGVMGVRQTGVAHLQVRVAGVVLYVHPLPQMEGETATHPLRQPGILRALPGERQQRRHAERGVADVVDRVGVFEIAVRGDAGQGLLGDVGEDGVVCLGGVRQVVQRAALVREMHLTVLSRGGHSTGAVRWARRATVSVCGPSPPR